MTYTVFETWVRNLPDYVLKCKGTRTHTYVQSKVVRINGGFEEINYCSCGTERIDRYDRDGFLTYRRYIRRNSEYETPDNVGRLIASETARIRQERLKRLAK